MLSLTGLSICSPRVWRHRGNTQLAPLRLCGWPPRPSSARHRCIIKSSLRLSIAIRRSSVSTRAIVNSLLSIAIPSPVTRKRRHWRTMIPSLHRRSISPITRNISTATRHNMPTWPGPIRAPPHNTLRSNRPAPKLHPAARQAEFPDFQGLWVEVEDVADADLRSCYGHIFFCSDGFQFLGPAVERGC